MTLLEQILPLLPHVSRPIQYLGRELHSAQKPWDEVRVTVGLCFPDVYEVGMAHLGLHILYHALNALPDVAAERLYAPWDDMEALMRTQRIPWFSVESHRAASEFDILGFTLQYELSYSNILNLLSLSGIPLYAAERSREHPLIIAGGPCALNPEPLAEFLDAVVIGDGETATPQLVAVYREWKASGASRTELLNALCRIPGVYVPSLYAVRYADSGEIAEIVPMSANAPERVMRQIEPDLDAVPYFSAPIVPYLQPVHDRVTLEIMRGCPGGCRFCQAGFIYRPKRERSADYLLALARSLLRESGYEEISLSSLSTGDYSQIVPLMSALMQTCEAARVSLSLPSMRVKTLTGEMASIISRVRKTGFTIAPEAGTQRLRNVINKGISEEDILRTAEEAFVAGWELLKLYFMIGLPTETDEDIEGLIELVYGIRAVGKRSSRKKVKLHVAISSFVPKAHTPFQWERMNSIEDLDRKQEILKQRLRPKDMDLKWHDVHASYLEGVFARGDRRLGRVLAEAHADGRRFDSWREHFDFSRWMDVFARTGVSPEQYLRERGEREMLPWQHLDSGVATNDLWNERQKAVAAQGTPPCQAHCRRCGVCRDEIRVTESAASVTPQSPETVSPVEQQEPQVKAYRLRATYTKTGLLRFLSHLEIVRLFQRAVGRCNVPIAFSQGYHPLPQISFGPALPVGTEGLRELADFFFTQPVAADEFLRQMNAALPEDIRMVEAHEVEVKAPSLSASLTQFTFQVFAPRLLVERGYSADYFARCLVEFEGKASFPVEPFKRRTEPVDIKPFIESLTLLADEEGMPGVEMTLRVQDNTLMKPEEVLQFVCAIPRDMMLDFRCIRVGCA